MQPFFQVTCQVMSSFNWIMSSKYHWSKNLIYSPGHDYNLLMPTWVFRNDDFDDRLRDFLAARNFADAMALETFGSWHLCEMRQASLVSSSSFGSRESLHRPFVQVLFERIQVHEWYILKWWSWPIRLDTRLNCHVLSGRSRKAQKS